MGDLLLMSSGYQERAVSSELVGEFTATGMDVGVVPRAGQDQRGFRYQ
jgi:hypothetical protein